MKIGVLAIIGSFIEHINVTNRAVDALREHSQKIWTATKVETVAIRKAEEVNIILSTTDAITGHCTPFGIRRELVTNLVIVIRASPFLPSQSLSRPSVVFTPKIANDMPNLKWA